MKLLEGQGEAPRDPKAIAWYMEHGIPDGDVKAAAVPGAIDAIVTLLKLYGTKSFEEVVQPTLAILDAGGPSWYIDTGSDKRIETGINWQADMAVTFRKLVESEKAAKGTRQQKLQAVSDRFYRGDIADALEAWYIEKGGFLRKADLAAHKTPVVDPLQTTYRGYTVYKAGPLTQGPYLSQTLRLLEGFDLKKMGFNSADYIHTVIEAEKLALADRDEYYGDPNFAKVPMQQLLSDQYTEMRRRLIDPKKASLELRPGDPYNMKPTKPPTITGPWHGGTTVMCVTDKFGNVIAATPSGLSSTAGVAGRTGIIHGSRLSSLNTFAGTPDVIQPGKRPRITLSPTLLFHDRRTRDGDLGSGRRPTGSGSHPDHPQLRGVRHESRGGVQGAALLYHAFHQLLRSGPCQPGQPLCAQHPPRSSAGRLEGSRPRGYRQPRRSGRSGADRH